ncbi:serine hydrolase [Rhizobiaceae bacterium BDR2-2]|uniref:Serine hydrolase n=1 Tax=Ectorhizobium quercum TaxID=2965071 RepID=A0AAE3MW48_9HYPH|nr:serine hydrolase [Ectorhizobium quercum]MCX8995496.1 serine hydrolase [Ectorhizobium quercum]
MSVGDDGDARRRLEAGIPEASALLYRERQDEILFSLRESRRYPPASLTKLLTLCLIDERLEERGLDPATRLAMPADVERVDSWWGFAPAERVGIDTLMQAAAVVSANEAANALADWHSGSAEAFTRLLNERAKVLGMEATTFSSPSGLGRHQQTTVTDMLRLVRHVHARHPRIAQLCARQSFEWNGRSHPNTNRLLSSLPGACGMKTGTLGGRINNIAFTARRGGELYVAIVLGAPTKVSRDEAVRLLMESLAP